MSVTSISLSPILRKKLDQVQEEKGYSSRSEVIRDAIRSYLSEHETTKALMGNVICTVTALYSHKGKHVDHDLLHLRYEYEGIVKGNLHMHVAEDDYAEIFITEGDAQQVSKFIQEMRIMKGIEKVTYSTVRSTAAATTTSV